MTFEYVSRVPPEGGAEQEMLCVSGASFRLTPVTDPDESETMFAVWVQSESSASVEIVGGESEITELVDTTWRRIKSALTDASDIVIRVPDGAIVYFYKAKLETGTKITDWSPAPEDAQDAIDIAQATADGAARTLQSMDSLRVAVVIKPEAAYIRPVKQADDGTWEVDSSGMYTRISADSYRIINPNADTAVKARDGSLIALDRSVIIDDDVVENIPGWCVVHRMREEGDGVING